EMTYPAADHKALTPNFLIGTPRLEFLATPTKQRLDAISNRDTLGCLCPKSRIGDFFPRGSAQVRPLPIPIMAWFCAFRAHVKSPVGSLDFGAARWLTVANRERRIS